MYADHDTRYTELRQKCHQADLQSSNLTALSQKWSEQVHDLQDGLLAFEITQIYETIATNLNLANENSVQTLTGYADQAENIEKLQSDTNILKDETKNLLANAQAEIARKTRISSELDALYTSYSGLAQTKGTTNIFNYLHFKNNQIVKDEDKFFGKKSNVNISYMGYFFIELSRPITFEPITYLIVFTYHTVRLVDLIKNNYVARLASNQFKSYRSTKFYKDTVAQRPCIKLGACHTRIFHFFFLFQTDVYFKLI